MTAHFLGFVLGYLIGSFPTAFIILRNSKNLDIRRIGSGNVGAMNTFEVTGSRSLGILVFIIDFIKGITAVAFGIVISSDFGVIAVAGSAAVVGHVFSPWIGFRGGRGLATAAGVFLMLGWVFIILWSVAWLIVHRLTRNIITGNLIATVTAPLIIMLTPDDVLQQFLAGDVHPAGYRMVTMLIAVIILVAHRGPIRDFWKSTFSHQPPS